MTALTHQKSLAKREVVDLMGKAYDLSPESERRDLVMSLAGSMASIMTLDQIVDWQRRIKQYLERAGNGKAIDAATRQ